MEGNERGYCNECIVAGIQGFNLLMQSTADEALSLVPYGKGDTLGFDGTLEYVIAKAIREYDSDAIFTTEETDEESSKKWPSDPNPNFHPKIIISDPLDRSSFFKKFLEELSKDGKKFEKIKDLISENNSKKIWEDVVAEKPASITGATSAITLISKGKPIFSSIINLITKEIFVACDMGIVMMKLPIKDGLVDKKIDLDYIFKNGNSLTFPSSREMCLQPDNYNAFVTFLGKTGYPENFRESKIIREDYNEFLHHSKPGGPSRIYYLSNMQKKFGPIGFILANGEKIIEWVHWLPVVRYARNSQGNPALKINEIFVKSPGSKDGILMAATKSDYSIFNCQDKGGYLDLSRIKNFERPSRFRATIVVTQADNLRINSILGLHNYRDIGKCL